MRPLFPRPLPESPPITEHWTGKATASVTVPGLIQGIVHGPSGGWSVVLADPPRDLGAAVQVYPAPRQEPFAPPDRMARPWGD